MPCALQILRMLYSSEWAVRIPAVIRRARAGNLMPFMRETYSIGQRLGSDIAHGLLLSVFCTEDAPLFEGGEAPPGTAETFLGSWPLNMMKMICSVWPRGTVPERYHEPVRSDVPVLLVSGEVDPVTPPGWAREAAQGIRAGSTVVSVAGDPGEPAGFVGVRVVQRGSATARGNGSYLPGRPRGGLIEPEALVVPARVGIVDRFHVSPSAGECAVAGALFRRVLSWLRTQGATDVEITVGAGDERIETLV